MWRNSFFIVLCAFAFLQVNAQAGSFTPHKDLFGPQVGYGISWGNRKDVVTQLYNKKPLGAVNFGLGYYYYTSNNQTIGASLLFVQNRWSYSTQQDFNRGIPDSKYQVLERSVILPLEYVFYVTPEVENVFLGVAVSPGYLFTKSLQKMRAAASDTATAMIIPETGNFNKFSLGFDIKFGADFDMGVQNAMRVYFNLSSRFYGGNPASKSRTNGLFLVAQYFFSR